mmetsp:Transcript_37797/g.53316  ORF Transcript_37797/g.53316 Transcript_37797/m.53316 type:complete len:126 (-) Transcript_37797:28-405(-)
MLEAQSKLKLAVAEAQADKDQQLSSQLEATIPTITTFGENLENAGEGIMKGKSVAQIGEYLIKCGEDMEILSGHVSGYAPELNDSVTATQRLVFASERMKDAGYELTGTNKADSDKPKGKGWIKG